MRVLAVSLRMEYVPRREHNCAWSLVHRNPLDASTEALSLESCSEVEQFLTAFSTRLPRLFRAGERPREDAGIVALYAHTKEPIFPCTVDPVPECPHDDDLLLWPHDGPITSGITEIYYQW